MDKAEPQMQSDYGGNLYMNRSTYQQTYDSTNKLKAVQVIQQLDLFKWIASKHTVYEEANRFVTPTNLRPCTHKKANTLNMSQTTFLCISGSEALDLRMKNCVLLEM